MCVVGLLKSVGCMCSVGLMRAVAVCVVLGC